MRRWSLLTQHLRYGWLSSTLTRSAGGSQGSVDGGDGGARRLPLPIPEHFTKQLHSFHRMFLDGCEEFDDLCLALKNLVQPANNDELGGVIVLARDDHDVIQLHVHHGRNG